MYLCLCYAISDKTLKALIHEKNPQNIKELQTYCPAGKNCGSCVCELKKMLARMKETKESLRPESTSETTL